ncbi:hypothetical protein LOAG_04309 [Loa loa]|uniref:Uncharacterized protein n=1 Tax=Loa loa TaxID=7209 RepID=A0A1S0U2F2_LOALO|nr:hypothetical protein LOAG_04309 [Loa loa]EFO24178.1 hypothetical protein LOAG_04309 [Loa loa]
MTPYRVYSEINHHLKNAPCRSRKEQQCRYSFQKHQSLDEASSPPPLRTGLSLPRHRSVRPRVTAKTLQLSAKEEIGCPIEREHIICERIADRRGKALVVCRDDIQAFALPMTP